MEEEVSKEMDQGKEKEREPATPALADVVTVSPLSISRTNPLLSPETCAHFDPDTFLLSRRFTALLEDGDGHNTEVGQQQQQVAQQGLHGILAELRSHGDKLSEEELDRRLDVLAMAKVKDGD